MTRLPNDIKNINYIKSEASKEKVVGSVILSSIGKEFILDKNFELNKSKEIKKNINQILIDITKKMNMIKMKPIQKLNNLYH